MNIFQFLSNQQLFGSLPEKERTYLAGIAREKNLKSGDMIFFEGEKATGFYLVFAGKVKIFKLSPNGREQVLHIVGPGESFAEVPIFRGGIFPANAQAIETSTVIFIPREELVRLIGKDPSLAMNMMAVLSRKLQEFSDIIENLSLRGVPERLSAYLLLHVSGLGKSDTIELDIKKGLLANLLGTTSESLSRMLGRMSALGMISVQGRTIHILDKNKLQEIAAGKNGLDGN